MSGTERATNRGRTGPSAEELERAAPPMAGGREVRIGGFVLLGILSFLTVLFLMTDPALFRGRYMVSTEVEDAGGIRRGDPVQMRGVNIGRVHRFEMLPEGVEITLEINGQWEIPRDSRASLGGLDLLGGGTVHVIPGESGEALEPGGAIPGESTEGFMDMAEGLGREARTTLGRIQRLLADPAIESVHGTVAELEHLTESLSDATRQHREEISRITASAERTAERVEELVGREELDRTLTRADSTLARMEVAGGNLERASATLEGLLSRIDAGEGTVGRLTADDEIYRQLNEVLEEIVSLSRDIQENPGRYIRLRIF